MLDGKEEAWGRAKSNAAAAVAELAEFFSGSKVLSHNVKDDNLRAWFDSIKAEVRCQDDPRPR